MRCILLCYRGIISVNVNVPYLREPDGGVVTADDEHGLLLGRVYPGLTRPRPASRRHQLHHEYLVILSSLYEHNVEI